MVAASIAKWQTGHKMLIGLMAAALACVGYGTASVLQAYGARSSEVVASGNRQRSEVTATGAWHRPDGRENQWGSVGPRGRLR
jgi:hypothetical protein